MKKFLFLTLCFAIPFAFPCFVQGNESLSIIEIASRATVSAMPNTVTLSFAVDTEAPSAGEAVGENAKRTESVLAALRKMMNENSRVWTTGFYLSPLYEKGDPTKPSGFRARNAVILESKMVNKAGAFIDEAAAAGVSRISNLAFTSDQEEDLRREAAVEALKQAKQDAEMLARAAGFAVKRIRKITYDQRDQGPLPIFREAAFTGAQTPVAVSEISVHANVHVVFELE